MNSIALAKSIRLNALKMVNAGGSSHIGSVLSIADILAVLYANILKINPSCPDDPERDRFILSKGHAGAGVYAALAELGFFEKKYLLDHCKDGSNMSGHVSHKLIPGVEFSTGSLGHGLPVGCGISYASKINTDNSRTYVLLSDGELGEGSNWEAFLFAGHHKLNNLTAIIDRNKLQSMKSTEETLALEPLAKKLSAFNWRVIEIDGHSHTELRSTLQDWHADKPTVLIANTTKGKGVSFMENSVSWHYKTPIGVDFETAIIDIESFQS